MADACDSASAFTFRNGPLSPAALSLHLHDAEAQCADELNIMASRSAAQVSFLLEPSLSLVTVAVTTSRKLGDTQKGKAGEGNAYQRRSTDTMKCCIFPSDQEK